MANMMRATGFLLVAAMVLVAEARFGAAGAGEHNLFGQGSETGCSEQGAESNPCAKGAEIKAMADKFAVLFRAYASKELGPELKAFALKIIDFTLNYLAKEKPNDMVAVNKFLQSSAQHYDKVVAKAGCK